MDIQMLAIPLESVAVDSPTQFPLYVKIGKTWVLLRAQGDSITRDRVEALREKNVSLLYVPDTNWNRYIANLEREVNAEEEVSPVEVSRIRSLLLAYSQEIERQKKFDKAHFQRFIKLADKLAVCIYKKPDLAHQMLRKYGDPSVYFVNHSLNVAVYSALLAKKHNIPLTGAKKLMCGALVHNTGYLFLPKQVIYKPSPLTPAEWTLIYEHPEKGAELLSALDAPSEVVTIALQHHERLDGKGYPSKKGTKEIHLFSRICAVADVFDALTNNAPYQKAHSSTEATKKMMSMRGKFDVAILELLAASGV